MITELGSQRMRASSPGTRQAAIDRTARRGALHNRIAPRAAHLMELGTASNCGVDSKILLAVENVGQVTDAGMEAGLSKR